MRAPRSDALVRVCCVGCARYLVFFLAGEAEGILQAFGFVASALLYIVAFLNLVRPRK